MGSGKVARSAPGLLPRREGESPDGRRPQELRDFTSILSMPVMDDVYLYGVMNFLHLGSHELHGGGPDVPQVGGDRGGGTIRNSAYNDARKRVRNSSR